MATKLTPKVEPKPQKKNTGYYIDGRSWDRGPQICLNGKPIFSIGESEPLFCCGIHEMGYFNFHSAKNVEYSPELQEVFNTFINHSEHNTNGNPCLRYLVLNRETKDKKTKQPEWFVKCLENYPGATTLDWMHNTNTHHTDIKPYFLPMYA